MRSLSPNHAGKTRIWPMAGARTRGCWSVRIGSQVVALFSAAVVLYTGMICIGGAMLGNGHNHDGHGHHDAAAGECHPHGTPESAPQDRHDGGATDCCSNHISTVPSADPSIEKPHFGEPNHLSLAVVLSEPKIVPAGRFVWEHGPPGESPSFLYAIFPQAPRAPPVAV
jgi:hypothetical protein